MTSQSFSIVTISFNQAEFLPRAIHSVLQQFDVDLEYIIVDPGSRDDSRKLITELAPQAKHLFEPDQGPADGLNKGFALATGDIFGYLNSDDEFLPHTLKHVAETFRTTNADVVIGHSEVIDPSGRRLRRSFSDFPEPKAIVYGAAVQMQPSTFIRRSAFQAVGGFNKDNKIAWDGELILDLALKGAKFFMIDEVLSRYRVHPTSITGTGKLADLRRSYSRRKFEKVLGRPYCWYDDYIRYLYLVRKYMRDPRALVERLRYGPVFGIYPQ